MSENHSDIRGYDISTILQTKLHNTTLKVTLLSVEKIPKLTWQERVWSQPYECPSQSIRPSSPSSWTAAMSCHDSPHWLHQLLMVGVDSIQILLAQNSKQMITQNIWILSLCPYSGIEMECKSWYQLDMANQNVNTSNSYILMSELKLPEPTICQDNLPSQAESLAYWYDSAMLKFPRYVTWKIRRNRY